MKGLKFVPTPKVVDKKEIRADILTLLYKLKWNFQFSGSISNPNNSEPALISIKTHGKAPPKPRDAKQLALCNQIDKIEPKCCKKSHRNLSPKLYHGLDTIIKKLDNIVIKEADKGSGVVIMSKSFYHRKILDMLEEDTYVISDIDCSTLVKRTKAFVGRYKSQLHKKELEAIIKQEAYIANFYGLPKIHKSQVIQRSITIQNSEFIVCPEPSDLKFRPIVSCRDCPTRSLSDLLDKLLRPFVNKVKFRLRDTWDFLKKLPPDAEEGDFTVTADISSLYTNIATCNGETAISYYYEQYPLLLPGRFSKTFLLEIYRFCQENLFFRYDDKIYRQINGTGMGRIYAPSLADLKQGYDEIQLERKIREIFSPALASFFLRSYGRYLDDIHFRWKTRWITELNVIKDTMNSIDSLINYEFEQAVRVKTTPFLF